ncbi:type I restriction endonuclease [Yersinia aleksiciae]|uniref:type I restriction endonuclease n=1 Tax=Yersinia aleksiciae TaxID=263819 RepID=UPI0011A9C56B|nr:type I restriction endonuclease [Yersinia aleksiciae]MDN0122028.1 type I restriction endonuclease [Yersinia aleksiciae]
MKIFAEKLRTHSDHVKKVSHHCSTEETTKQALILPMLDILGFNSYDPTKVKAEYGADFPGVKVGERVDYALFCHGVPVMFIEAKGYNQKLDNHCPQLSRYFNATPEVTIAAITNGTQWRFFTDLKQRNIMDASPFLQIDVDEASDSDAHQLYQFRHDQFQPEALRTLAEESIYLSAFTDVISDSLRNVDSDFVRYVASRSSVQRQLNQKFLDTITPLVKMAVERAVSAMVVSGLSMASNKEKEIDAAPISELTQTNDTAPVIDSENPNIVTTHNERLFYSNIELLLGEGADLSAKDTASYYNILYQGKSNRWVVRYFDSKQRPSIILPIELDEKAVAEVERAGLELAPGNQIIIDRPENILRLSGLISDSYNYCVDDDNFRNKKK